MREGVPAREYFGRVWKPASSWWGAGLNRAPIELDVVAESEDGKELLVGEAKWSSVKEPDRLIAALLEKARNLPFSQGRNLLAALWVRECPPKARGSGHIFTPSDVLGAEPLGP